MMDIYQSSAPVDAPVILYVHGGAWVAGDKRTELLHMGMPINEGPIVPDIDTLLNMILRCIDRQLTPAL